VEARKAAGMTRVELSKKLRRPQSFVSKYEGGERRLDVPEFIEVAEALGADPLAIIQRLQR
jgi:transcriptional regulator with XRE-family HTH domain